MPGVLEAPTVGGGGPTNGGWSSNSEMAVNTTWSVGADDESGIEDSPVDGLLEGPSPQSQGPVHDPDRGLVPGICGNGYDGVQGPDGRYERRPSLQRGSRSLRPDHAQHQHQHRGTPEARSTSAPPHVHHSMTVVPILQEQSYGHDCNHLSPFIHITQDASQAEVSIDESPSAPQKTTTEQLQDSHEQVSFKSSKDSPSKNEHKKHHQSAVSDGLQTAEALPTDMSDSTESDKENKAHGSGSETVVCPVIGTHHIGREVINAVYNLPVDAVFTLLFTNSTFMLDLYAARKTFDVVASPWQSNNETNQKLRQVTYTLTLPPNSFGPKVSHVTETQVLSTFSKPGEMYTVDAEACNAGIPYADSFFVGNHWCLTRESNNETRISVWTQVKYKKSVWGFMKGVIDKNSYAGVESMLADINNSLVTEADRNSQKRTRRRRRVRGGSKVDPVEVIPPIKDTLHHKDHHTKIPLAPPRKMRGGLLRSSVPIVPPTLSPISPLPHSSAPQITTNRNTHALPNIHVDTSSSSEGPVRMVVATLVVLLTLNALLYYKLWDLEDKLHLNPRANSNPYITLDPNMLRPTSGQLGPVEEWVRVLQQQEALHAAEVDRWRRSIEDAAGFLRKAEESLRGLHSSIPENQASKAQILLMQLQKIQELEKSDRQATTTNSQGASDSLNCPSDPSKPPDDNSPTKMKNSEGGDGQEL